MSQFKKYKLGDIIDIKHGYAFKGEFFSDIPTNDILLTPGNFSIGGGFKSDKFKYYKGAVPQDYVLKKGDLVVTMTDLSIKADTLGYSALIPEIKGKKILHNQRIGLLQFKTDKVDKVFIYWLLRTNTYQNFIVGSATGTTVKHTAPSRIKEYEFEAPENKNTQTLIASILSSLDDKIELNRRTNQTLEQIAQTLFKKYFVDDIDPENLREVSLLDIAFLLSGGTPKTDVSQYWNGDVFWISAKDVGPNNKSFIVECERKITQEGLKNCSAKLLPEFSTIITARGTVGNICINPIPVTISQSNYALKTKIKDCDFVLYQIVQWQLEEIMQNRYGTVFDTITTQTLRDLKISIPKEDVFYEIEDVLKPIYLKILLNIQENKNLMQLRNSLLPKLMSGEIEVNIAEKELAEA
jgi:type I restriction enzyme, S subunit